MTRLCPEAVKHSQYRKLEIIDKRITRVIAVIALVLSLLSVVISLLAYLKS
jgi:hypothetical protein